MSSAQSTLQRLRNFLRSDMRTLRWVFLALYVLILAGLSYPFFFPHGDGIIPWLILAGAMFACQGMFLVGAGTIQLCRPIEKRRLWMPVAAAAFMAMLLTVGLGVALVELFHADEVWDGSAGGFIFFSFVAGSWLGWGVLIWSYARRWKRMQVLSRLTAALLAGSLAELLAAVPSHLIVSRRPGCLVGLWTMLGILAGVYVMLFAFGPGIAILFLRPRYRREQMESWRCCEACGYDLRGTHAAGRRECPECGAPAPPVPPGAQVTV